MDLLKRGKSRTMAFLADFILCYVVMFDLAFLWQSNNKLFFIAKGTQGMLFSFVENQPALIQ